MRDLHELNINVGGLPVDRPPPSNEEIAEFEQAFDLRFPDELRALLDHANGGHPELDTFVPDGGDEDDAWNVNHFYHLSGDRSDNQSLWQAAATWRPILGERYLPFASDPGGAQVVLDLGADPHPVLIAAPDVNPDPEVVAPSIESLIDRLHLNPDYI
jgi:cell wall assembly regulator SMI1